MSESWSFDFNGAPGQEVTEYEFHYFLEVVPPALMSGAHFQVGEPHDHVRFFDGAREYELPIYATFHERTGKYYYLGFQPRRSHTREWQAWFQAGGHSAYIEHYQANTATRLPYRIALSWAHIQA